MKKTPLSSYGKSASQRAVRARLAKLERPLLPLPQQCTAVAIITNNCTQQLTALAQAYARNDLQGEIPQLTTTARNAAKLARDMLSMLLDELGEKQSKAKTKP